MKPTNLKEFVAKSILVRMYAQNKQMAELKELLCKYTCWVCKQHDNNLYDECYCGKSYCLNHDLCTYFDNEKVICIGCKPDKKRSCNVCKTIWYDEFNEPCPSCSNKR